jgi:hypothetical protein
MENPLSQLAKRWEGVGFSLLLKKICLFILFLITFFHVLCSLTDEWLCCSSDKGTVHVFALQDYRYQYHIVTVCTILNMIFIR